MAGGGKRVFLIRGVEKREGKGGGNDFSGEDGKDETGGVKAMDGWIEGWVGDWVERKRSGERGSGMWG